MSADARLRHSAFEINIVSDEMIMTRIAILPEKIKPRRTNREPATLQRWWLAYRNWRIERAAVTRLLAMSDHELKDIGIGRSEVEAAVSIKHQQRDRCEPH